MTRYEMGKWIVDQEARRDSKGNIRLYILPSGDGGGRYEYAGINQRYHPKALQTIVRLVNAGRHDDAEEFAINYIANYTEVADSWSILASADLFLRDTCFNRGPGGAAKILQKALGVSVDGVVGKNTLAALRTAENHPRNLIKSLREAREWYERKVVGYRSKFWGGLTNRWNNAATAAYALA